MSTTMNVFRGVCLCLGVLLWADRAIVAADHDRLVEAARKAYEAKSAAFDGGISNDPERLHAWSCRWLDAELQANSIAMTSASAYSAHLDRMEALKRKVAAKAEAGARGGTAENLAATEYFVAEAEAWLKKGNRIASR